MGVATTPERPTRARCVGLPRACSRPARGEVTPRVISAVAFELTGAAYDRSGPLPVVLGLTAGALTFYAGDRVIDRAGGESRKDPTGTDAGASASTALVLGALLDGIPESAAIGVSLLGGGFVGHRGRHRGVLVEHP